MPADNPLEVFFDLVPTGAALYAPIYDAGGELVDFRFVRLNLVGQRLLGLPAQPPRTFREYYPNSVPTGIFDQYRTAFLTGQAAAYDVPYEGDGIDTYFQLVAQRSGEVLVVSFTDAHDQDRTAVEEALRKSKAREKARRADAETRRAELEGVFAQAPVGLVLFQGPEYRIDLANSMMGQIWGRAVPQVLGRPVFEAMPDLKQQGFEDILADVYHRGIPYSLWELPVTMARTHTGLPAQGFFNVIYQPHRDRHGDIVAIVCLVIEVTDQVLARQQVQALNDALHARNDEFQQANTVLADTQQQLRQLNQELEGRVRARTQDVVQAQVETAALNEALQASNGELNEANRQLVRTNVDLDTFVYTASHDLKAPITNIEGIVLALRDTLPPAVQQDELVAHLLGLLDSTVARFLFTIAQLTDISQLQLAHVGPAEAVVLAQVVENVRLDLAPAIVAADAQLTVAVAPDVVVSFSPANLRSIVYNLLSNAVKYRDPLRPAQVQVRAAQTPQAVVLTVQDNGLGLSEVQQRQLFGLFQRLHTHVEGTGVGLYITKRLVENAGGTITVQSQPDAGTTFTVTFPA